MESRTEDIFRKEGSSLEGGRDSGEEVETQEGKAETLEGGGLPAVTWTYRTSLSGEACSFFSSSCR